jgi:hypothetical protein
MAGDIASPIKDVVQVFSAMLIPVNVGLMADAEVLARFRGAFLVSKEDYFGTWVEERPALESIPLNDVALANEGLRSREKRQHGSSSDVRKIDRLLLKVQLGIQFPGPHPDLICFPKDRQK